mmetsp:Transcript_28315/g.77742  ORF Transcript_28315/g.77742 Transcript_28315/m.77742 type:complete len:183 (-) Transcript_28315:43-591(-)
MKPTLRTTLIGRLAQRRRPGSLAVLGSSSLLSTTSGCQSQSPSRRPWSSSSNHHQKSFSTGRRMLDIHHRHDPVIRMSRHGFQNTPTRQCSSTGSSSNQDDATTTTTTTTVLKHYMTRHAGGGLFDTPSSGTDTTTTTTTTTSRWFPATSSSNRCHSCQRTGSTKAASRLGVVVPNGKTKGR